MQVLLIGSGGREHALAWAIARSTRLTRLRALPGSDGMADLAERVSGEVSDVESIVDHVRREGYDLVVVGPEAPLVAGLADRLAEIDVPVFGPSARAAELEGSKVFSKLFMQRHGIPSAAFRVFDGRDAARDYLTASTTAYPLVVKADGLAAGKGVTIADRRETALAAADGMLSGRDFGDAGRRIVVEECLQGREASFFVLCDGREFVELATCQDYKRAHDGDRGPNTGGMGSYSPSVYLDEKLRHTIVSSIVAPTVAGLAAEERPYRGVLYVGLMLTDRGPQVLEYNVRFGDPETQVLMPRLDGDWLELLAACARGELAGLRPRWKEDAAVCVVMASGGYPGPYGKGTPITGLDEAAATDGCVVFHAGTRAGDGGRFVTSGGRVLGVTALGAGLAAARGRAYQAVRAIGWQDEHHRNDIAADAVEQAGDAR